MKQKVAAKLWKRVLSTGLSLAMAVTLLPPVEVRAVEGESTVLKAGSIDVSSDKLIKNQPFASITGSEKFSSPVLATRKVVKRVGTDNIEVKPTTGITTDLLIAAAEAKYNTTSDGGGQDIIASVSSDGGKTWKYSYPLRFPDSAASGNEEATTVSDPVLIEETKYEDTAGGVYVSGGTVYLLANVYPGGVAPADGFTYPGAGTGYVEIDGAKYLALTDTYEKAAVNPTAESADYKYYVGAFAEDGYAPVNDMSSKTVATIDSKQYYVDKWYNLYSKDGDAYTEVKQEGGQLDAAEGATDELQQNVFYKGSMLHVYNTSYIMCVTSANTADAEEGEVWSAPEILNPQLEQGEDELLSLCSGKGLVTTAGRFAVPVYIKKATEDTTLEEAEETAGMIWKYNDCEHGEAGMPWAHRADVPAFTDAETQTEEPNWMKGGEIVELSRGQLRMFIRHGRGNIYYADAGRSLTSDEPGGESSRVDRASVDMFTFNEPVQTGSSITRDAKVSALEYSKAVNPSSNTASKAILTAMPTGTGHTNGMFVMFGRDADSDVKNPTMSRIQSHVLSNGNFASATMDEMNYGSNIGLVWENGRGTVRFENFYMLDLLANSAGNTADNLYVKGLEYDLELRPNGDAYTRSYNVTGQENMEPSDRDWTAAGNDNFEVSFNAGDATTKEVPALYSIKGGDVTNAKLSDVFNNTPDTAVDIENAEFTFTRPSNTDELKNVYTVYSATAERYLTNYTTANTFFSTTLRNNMRFVYDATRKAFLVSKPVTNGSNPATDGTRYLIFNTYGYTFNSNERSGADTGQYKYGLQLLRKLTSDEAAELGEENVINLGPADSDDYKYTKITSGEGIEDGRKYLIAYEVPANTEDTAFADGGYVILYPRNNFSNYGKLVYGTRTAPVAAAKTLTITPKAATTDPVDLTVNNITYHITVKHETITVPKGGSTFIDNVDLDDVNLGSTSLVTKLEATESRKALFDCMREANNSLSGYSTTPNWEANVANAEFVITEAGTGDDGLKLYHIFSELEGNYLVNTNAGSYFDTTPATQTLTLTDENADPENASFEIRRRATVGNNRYVYFFYQRMAFDAVSEKGNYGSSGDFGFEFLKKRTDGIEDMSDPIPGYQRVNKIESGESYLITEYYKETTGEERDVIIVLYPRNGITNQSKMYTTTEVPGVRLTASANAETGNTAEITIGGTTYIVEIEGTCDHNYPKTVTSVEATCKKPGTTGDVICSNCREVLEEGTPTPVKDHTWTDNWTTTDPVIDRTNKTVTDGARTRTCSGGEETETEVISGEAYLLKTIGEKIAQAETEKSKTDDYAAETIKALEDAIAAATDAVSGQTPADVAGKIDALIALESALDPDNMVSQDDYDSRKDTLDGLLTEAGNKVSQTDVYTEESLAALQAVLDEIGENLSYTEMQQAIDDLTAALDSLITLDEKTCEEMLPSLKEALASKEQIAAGGQKNYTDESWKKFINAYNTLNGKTDEELIAMGSVELTRLLNDLNTKLEEKGTTPPPSESKIKVNTDYTVSGVVYTVTDAVKNEVVLKKGANAKKFTVPATVSINSVTCKVVGIGDSAFSGYKKLKNVIIGENVTSIGAKAFFKCTKLSKVTMNGAKAPAIKKAAFKKTASKVTVKAKKLNKKQKKAFLKVLKKTGKISKKSVVK